MKISEYLQLGNKMKQARLQSNISQQDMAKKLGLGKSTYCNYENSYSEPQMETIEKFCDVLRITPTDLFQLTLPDKLRSPIRRFSDFLFVLSELDTLGIPVHADFNKDEITGKLVANFSMQNAQMVALANNWEDLQDKLARDLIDQEEYDMLLSDLMQNFNVPIVEYSVPKDQQ